MKKVYIIGKYSDNNVIDVLKNIREGIKVSARLLKLGYAPFCPWLDHQFLFYENISLKEFYEYSLKWLEVSDLVLVLPNYKTSGGSLAEIKKAKELGIPIKYL